MIIATFSIAMTRHPASHLGRTCVFHLEDHRKTIVPTTHAKTNFQSVRKPSKSLLHSIQTSSIFFYYISPQMKLFSLWVGNRLLDIWSKIFLQPGVCVFHSKLCALLPSPKSFSQLPNTWFTANFLCTAFHKLAVYFYNRNIFWFMNQSQYAAPITEDSFFFFCFLLFCTVWFCCSEYALPMNRDIIKAGLNKMQFHYNVQ